MATIQSSIVIIQTQAAAFQHQMKAVFFPKKVEKVDLQSSLAAQNNQRIARITKTAIYIFAALATAAMIVLTEAAIIAWPVTIPVILITAIAWIVFYRLNKMDQQYTQDIDDKMRSDLCKKEMEKLFLEDTKGKELVVERTLTDLNQLLGHPVFEAPFISKVREIQTKRGESKTLAEAAQLLSTPFTIDSQQKWREQGRYGWNSYEYEVKMAWSGKATEPIEVSYKKTAVER